MLTDKKRLLILSFFFAAIWLLLALLTPKERTLGAIIRWVFLHGSLTQAAVYLFLISAFLAAGYLLGNKKQASWMMTLGGVAFGFWALGFIISMIPARLAWGVFVDFHEPRTQMTLRVIAVGVIFLILAWWVSQPRFTAIILIIFAFVLLFLVRSTSLIRHPANPIGTSSSMILPLLYTGVVISAVLSGLAFSRYLAQKGEGAS